MRFFNTSNLHLIMYKRVSLCFIVLKKIAEYIQSFIEAVNTQIKVINDITQSYINNR